MRPVPQREEPIYSGYKLLKIDLNTY